MLTLLTIYYTYFIIIRSNNLVVNQTASITWCQFHLLRIFLLNNIIWFYRLSSKCKWATVKSFKADVSSFSWRRANARNVSFETLYGGYFTLSTKLIKPNNLVMLPHRRSTTVSLETYPLYSFPLSKRPSPIPCLKETSFVNRVFNLSH